jgi:hypothetical protein
MPDGIELPISSASAPRYRYYTVNIVTNKVIGEIPFEDVNYERSVKSPGAFDGKITVTEQTNNLDLYNATLPGKTALYVVRDNEAVWGGIIWGRTYDLVGRSLAISASEFTSYLSHRIIWKTYSHSFTGKLNKPSDNSYTKISLINKSLKAALSLTDESGNPTTVTVNFTDNNLRKYNGDYEVRGLASDPPAPADPGRNAFYVNIPLLPAKSGVYDGVGVTMKSDTYDYLRDIITSTFSDFTEIEFPNEVVEPGIKEAIVVTSKQLSISNATHGVATLTTETDHNLTLGQRVEIANVDPMLDGLYAVSETPNKLTFKYEIANPVSAYDKSTKIYLDDSLDTAVPVLDEKDEVSYRQVSTAVAQYITTISRLNGEVTLTFDGPHNFEKGQKIILTLEASPQVFWNVSVTTKKNGKSTTKKVKTNTFNYKKWNYTVQVTSAEEETLTYADPKWKTSAYNKTFNTVTLAENYAKPAEPIAQLLLYPKNSSGYNIGDQVYVDGVDQPQWPYELYDGYRTIYDVSAGQIIKVSSYRVLVENPNDEEDQDNMIVATYVCDADPQITEGDEFEIQGITAYPQMNGRYKAVDGSTAVGSKWEVKTKKVSITWNSAITSAVGNGTAIVYTVDSGEFQPVVGQMVTVTGTTKVPGTGPDDSLDVVDREVTAANSTSFTILSGLTANTTGGVSTFGNLAQSTGATLQKNGNGWISYRPDTSELRNSLKTEPDNTATITNFSYNKKTKIVTLTTKERHNFRVGDRIKVSFGKGRKKDDQATYGNWVTVTGVGDLDSVSYKLIKKEHKNPAPTTSVATVAKAGTIVATKSTTAITASLDTPIQGVRSEPTSDTGSTITVYALDNDLKVGDYVSTSFSTGGGITDDNYSGFDSVEAPVKVTEAATNYFRYTVGGPTFASDSANVYELAYVADAGSTTTSANARIRIDKNNIRYVKDFTVTIASPAVVTASSHGLTANTMVTLYTKGALPTGLTAGNTYYVLSTGLTANSFRLSATLNGTAINTSGTQSGTHGLYKVAYADITANVVSVDFSRVADNQVIVTTDGTLGGASAVGRKVTLSGFPDPGSSFRAASNTAIEIESISYKQDANEATITFKTAHGLDETDDIGSRLRVGNAVASAAYSTDELTRGTDRDGGQELGAWLNTALPSTTYAISSYRTRSDVTTFITSAAHGLAVGDVVSTSGFANTSYNLTGVIIGINETKTSLLIRTGLSNTAGAAFITTGLGSVSRRETNLTPHGIAITSAVSNGTLIQYTAFGHKFTTGDRVRISGFANTSYNILDGVVSGTPAVDGSTFTVDKAITAGTASGTLGRADGFVGGHYITKIDSTSNEVTIDLMSFGHDFNIYESALAETVGNVYLVREHKSVFDATDYSKMNFTADVTSIVPGTTNKIIFTFPDADDVGYSGTYTPTLGTVKAYAPAFRDSTHNQPTVGDLFQLSGFRIVNNIDYSYLNLDGYTVVATGNVPNTIAGYAAQTYVYLLNPKVGKTRPKYTTQSYTTNRPKLSRALPATGNVNLNQSPRDETESRNSYTIDKITRASDNTTATVYVTDTHNIKVGDLVVVDIFKNNFDAFTQNYQPLTATAVTANSVTYTMKASTDVEAFSYNSGIVTLYFKGGAAACHNYVVGDSVVVPAINSSGYAYGGVTATVRSVSPTTISYLKAGLTAGGKKKKTAFKTVISISRNSSVTVTNEIANGLLSKTPTIYKRPVVYSKTYGEFPNNAGIGGITFSTMDYSNKNLPNAPIFGSDLQTVAEILDKYSNGIDGFEYRIDPGLTIDANGNKQFTRNFVLIPIYPKTLTDYLETLPEGKLARGQVATPAALGADKVIFEYPGNITNVSMAEKAETSATRIFVRSGDGKAGSGAEVAYSGAADVDLLQDNWPLLDKKESVTWPLKGAENAAATSAPTNTDEWGNHDDETDYHKSALRFLKESKPPAGDFNIDVNGSVTPVIGSYNPGDWCSIIINDNFVKTRLDSVLEPRKDVIVRKIDSIKVAVPNNPAFPEKITLNLIPDWQVDAVGK